MKYSKMSVVTSLTLTVSLFVFATTKAYADSCNGLSSIQKSVVKKNFNHDPFAMISSLIQVASGDFNESKKNLSMELSFDLPMIYRQTARLHRSKIFKDPYMNFLKSNFFGFYRSLYKEPSKVLMRKRFDFLNSTDRQNINKGSISFTGFDRSRCSKEESKSLGCKSHYYKISAMISPELSCEQGHSFKKGFETSFYLSYSKNYGFKIVDIDLSGKRLVLELFDHMSNLKSRGYNNSALISQLESLQSKNTPFQFPKKMSHSNNIMAIIQSEKDRLPTSL